MSVLIKGNNRKRAYLMECCPPRKAARVSNGIGYHDKLAAAELFDVAPHPQFRAHAFGDGTALLDLLGADYVHDR